MAEVNIETLEKEVAQRLQAGEPPEQVADDLGLEVGEIDGNPAVVLPGWTVTDGDCEVHYDVASARKAAQQYVDDGDYGQEQVDSTAWVDVAVWRVGVALDKDGDVYPGEIDDSRRWHTIAIDPEEPECVADEHDWHSPHSVVGGIAENPGVWGHGGGVIVKEVCAHCGVYRIRDTWAQRPDTGEQGLESVKCLPADEVSLRWVERLREDD